MDDPIAQFRDWVQGLPPFTKVYLVLAVLLSLLSTMQVVTYMQYYFAVELAYEVVRTTKVGMEAIHQLPILPQSLLWATAVALLLLLLSQKGLAGFLWKIEESRLLRVCAVCVGADATASIAIWGHLSQLVFDDDFDGHLVLPSEA